MEGYDWLIWSNEHDAWWASNERGYVKNRGSAGRYSFERACEIVFNANKHLHHNMHRPNEAMVRVESYCCAAPLVDGVQCLGCGADGR